MGRGYVGAWLGSGVRVSAVRTRGFGFDAEFELPSGLQELPVEAARASEFDLGIGFLHPPHLDRLLGRRKANLFVWEADRVPGEWIEPLRQQVDVVAVPSAFTRSALVASGLPEGCCVVAPYGYDPVAVAASTQVADEAGTGDAGDSPHDEAAAFRFVSVVAPHYRKGVVELLRAYSRAFTSRDGVLLTIKSTYDPPARRRRQSFEIEGWEAELERCGLRRSGAPRCELEVTAADTDAETVARLRRADVVVQPSWGESFGLVILEAAASGRPVVTTGWGAPTEFLPRTEDWLPYRLEEAPAGTYVEVPGARVARPSEEALAARLRWHYEHAEASRELGRQNARHVRRHTWEAAAGKLLAAVG